MPHKNLGTFFGKNGMTMLIGAMCKLILKEAELKEWAIHAFGVPKKNGMIRLVIDF